MKLLDMIQKDTLFLSAVYPCFPYIYLRYVTVSKHVENEDVNASYRQYFPGSAFLSEVNSALFSEINKALLEIANNILE